MISSVSSNLFASDYNNSITISKSWDLLKNETDKIKFNYLDYSVDDGIHRYDDIFCVSDTAIRVSGFPFFLHANQMGTILNKEFIATQAPISEAVLSFYEKVFESDGFILDLTSEKDSSELNCYFPSQKQIFQFGSATTIELESEKNGLSTYRMHLNGREKILHRFRFKDWMDNKSPPSLEQLNFLIDLIEKREEKVIWVNCKAGAGRTGTFLAALKIKEGAENRSITRFNIVPKVSEYILNLRENRCEYMVQTKEQFEGLIKYGNSLLT